MKKWIFISVMALIGMSATAQQQFQQSQWVFQEAWNGTGGACDVRANPHSYACTKWNFDGNHVFPLMQLNWESVLQGEWFTVTYVNPQTENNGPEFYMAKLPIRPSIPLGMINARDNSRVGSMWVSGGTMVWNNWLGHTLATEPQSFRYLDAHTVEMQAREGQYVHLFRCRDFNRNGNHHLLCSWDMWFPEFNQWQHKGYIGMLQRHVWDNFTRGL